VLVPPRPRRLPLLLLRQGARAGAPAAAAAVHPSAVPVPLRRRLQDRLRGGPVLRLYHHVIRIHHKPMIH
jgi:hypothetical protein